MTCELSLDCSARNYREKKVIIMQSKTRDTLERDLDVTGSSIEHPDRQDDTTESQIYDMEELTENAKTVLLENLPQDGGLVRIVTVWPTLSDELKNAIVKMIS